MAWHYRKKSVEDISISEPEGYIILSKSREVLRSQLVHRHKPQNYYAFFHLHHRLRCLGPLCPPRRPSERRYHHVQRPRLHWCQEHRFRLRRHLSHLWRPPLLPRTLSFPSTTVRLAHLSSFQIRSTVALDRTASPPTSMVAAYRPQSTSSSTHRMVSAPISRRAPLSAPSAAPPTTAARSNWQVVYHQILCNRA